MTKPVMPASLCPSCYLCDGIDTELPRPRTGAMYKCPKGHTWEDIEQLQNQQDLARHKRSQLAPKDPEEEAQKDPTTIVPMANQPTGNEIIIAANDKARISKLIEADFSDGSTLYGSIWSIVADLKAANEEIALLKNKPSPGAADALNPNMEIMQSGDMPVTVIVPEGHVMPLKDIAEACNQSVPEYMNAIIANGFDGGWFY